MLARCRKLTEYRAMTTESAQALYDQRLKRTTDAIALRRPDRVPTAFNVTFWLAKYGGISHRQLMYDYATAQDITRRAIFELEPDSYAPPHFTTFLGPTMEARLPALQWPGLGSGITSLPVLDRVHDRRNSTI
jgi:hypothetical protein